MPTHQPPPVTAEHDQALTLHLRLHVEAHEPRADDPHYHLFEQAKARLKRLGLWKCIVGDEHCEGTPELHHSHVEFSEINAVDPAKIERALGLHFTSDEDFQQWVESPGNLEVLCSGHHRLDFGVHVLPAALWEANRFLRAGAEPAATFVPSREATGA